MSKRQGPQSYKELLQALSDLFDEIEPNTPDEIASYLDVRGYDRTALISSLRADMKKAISDSPLNWRNKLDDGVVHSSDSSQTEKQELPRRQEIIDAIRGIYTKRNTPLVAHFRNLEEATDEDLLSLLEDLKELDDEQEG